MRHLLDGLPRLVFEGEAAHETLQGVAVPRKQTLGDWLTGAEHGEPWLTTHSRIGKGHRGSS
jgi:hypothetical protein